MYESKTIWLLMWPAMIALAYFLIVFALNKLNNQIDSDPLGEDTNP